MAHESSVSEARLRSLVESSPCGTFATAVEGATGRVRQGDAPARDRALETAREVVRRTTHDPLSGPVNRTGFETRLKGALERTRAHRGGGALMHIDLDRFRLINDACGRAAGDRLLAQVAMLVRDTVRGSVTLALRCFVKIARVMGLKTVAEFVDSPQTLRRIGELGVDFAQGFQVHRPRAPSMRSSTKRAACRVVRVRRAARQDFGPKMNQAIRPTTGRNSTTRTQMIFAMVLALLPTILMIA